MTRVLALDLGERRIGVAVSDSTGVLATPHGVVTRSTQRAADHRAIAALVEETGAELVVVGLPLTLRGEVGPAARNIASEAAELADVLPVPVETFDERFTTVEAARRREARAPAAPGRRPGSSRRGPRRTAIDAEAAAILLEAYLESSRRGPSC